MCVSSAVGDSDGLFKGKRYFTCTPKHGKMVRINNVIAVLYPKMVTVLCWCVMALAGVVLCDECCVVIVWWCIMWWVYPCAGNCIPTTGVLSTEDSLQPGQLGR